VLGLGIGGLFPLSLTLPLDYSADAEEAARLTAMTFFVGYLLAVLGLIGGPLVTGAAVALLFGVFEEGSVWQGIAIIPEFIWELSLGIWPIVKGFNPSAIARLQNVSQ
jgi:cyanate permease